MERFAASRKGSSPAMLSKAASGQPTEWKMMELKTVGVCETQPISAEGLRSVLKQCPDLAFHRAASTVGDGLRMIREDPPDILLLDKGFGAHTLFSWITELRDSESPVTLAVWGTAISEPEALRMLQHGVRGILRKNAHPESILSCLRAVATGSSWMEESLFRDAPRRERYHRSELTPRERQVLELVEQGLKNREIARELGIRPGTVKIHLKHIFEKTGVRGRYGLALNGMRDRGLLPVARV